MKLDPRIIEGKKPLTYFDIEEAKHFIGRKGYFSDCVPVFANLDNATPAILGMVNDNDWFQPFMATSAAAAGKARYFLPEEWVQEKEPEPKYRPYKNYGEMFQDVSVGQLITFRDKGYTSVHYTEIVEVYENKCGDWFVVIGNGVRSFAGWFDTIEVKDFETGRWVPFGVKE